MGNTSESKESLTKQEIQFQLVTTRLVMGADLNAANTLFGGILIQWVDEAASVFVMEVLGTHNVVTKKISEVLYNEPTRLGEVLEFLFRIKHVGTTSLTVECAVKTKIIDSDDTQRTILNCDLVFVKVDRQGRPSPHHYDCKSKCNNECNKNNSKDKS